MAKETKRIIGGQVREVTLTEQAQSSLELARNAKGEYSYTVKLYFTDDQEAHAVDRLLAVHQELHTKLPALGTPAVQVKLTLKEAK